MYKKFIYCANKSLIIFKTPSIIAVVKLKCKYFPHSVLPAKKNKKTEENICQTTYKLNYMIKRNPPKRVIIN